MAAPTVCPHCSSELLQPLRSSPCSDGEVLLELRCPECFTWMQSAVSKLDAEELDRLHAGWRASIVDAYDRCVAESMEALAFCLGMALELDLLGADDFAPRRGPVRAPPAVG